MAAITPPPERTGRLGTIVVVALVLVLAYQLAYWTWVFVAPQPRAAMPESRGAVDLDAIARMFGASPPGAAVASTSGLRLKGVIAPTPGVEASAIFSTGAGKDIAVYLDGEVQPGVKLVEVHPDFAVVSRAGVRERVDLEKPATRVATGNVPANARGGRPGAGFKLNVSKSGSNTYTISRKELDNALSDPNQLNYLGVIGPPVKDGVRMQAAPPNSLAQKLGLQPGDIIRKVNGQKVASTGDLARLYTQFAQISLIQAEVLRGGAIVQLSYSIQP
ncbi:MAG TPA: type II secretion system protein N [Usitatibacter sp.]|nr:type II secretion system protein N [Usitatibacter sp.]